jgi:mannose-6-phosphate isomerase
MLTMTLYPLKFAPRFVPKMWGGRRLATVLNKPLPGDDPIGESWELYDFPPGAVGADGRQGGDDPRGWTSIPIVNGPHAGRTLHDLMVSASKELLGSASAVQTPHGPQFPLLIKFLDAEQDLSVQVHPPVDYTRTHPDAHLKNECWHVLAHEPGARLLIGPRPGTTREQFRRSLDDGTCESQLNAVPVVDGETHYLPSGTVHALGAGVLAAEVQTPSDTTYRVFDFNRVDPKTGKPRGLHVEQAMQCIDFDTPPPPKSPAGNSDAAIVKAPQFTVTRRVRREYDEARYDAGELRVLMVVDGSAIVKSEIGDTPVSRGETVLLPASVNAVLVPRGSVRYLEVTLPR